MSQSIETFRAYAVSAGAAVAGALGVSLCCIGPVVLLAFGVSGPHFIDALQPYRPWLIGGELVAYGSYRYFRPTPTCEADQPPGAYKQIAFWIALVVIVGSLLAVAW
jgi:mercuric ion transport protein